jgi:hypothetical protein
MPSADSVASQPFGENVEHLGKLAALLKKTVSHCLLHLFHKKFYLQGQVASVRVHSRDRLFFRAVVRKQFNQLSFGEEFVDVKIW